MLWVTLITFLASMIRMSAVFLYGSVGETITEKSGHLNLGIPGVMSVGAAAGYLTVYGLLKAEIYTDLLLYLPLITTIVAGGLMGLLYSFMTVTLRSNQNVTGLAITTFGAGLAGYLKEHVADPDTANKILQVGIEFYQKLFVIESDNAFVTIFLSHGILVYLAIVIAIVAHIVMSKTRTGLHLRAVGESPATADAAGINVTGYKYVATIIGSAIAALGGLFAIMDYMGGSWEYIIEGFGWLSIALVIFTMWRPALAIPGSLIFGGLYVANSYILNLVKITLAQQELFKLLPYVMTIIVLIITSIVGSKKTQPPASLGMNYFREER